VSQTFFLFSHQKVLNAIYIIMNYERGQKKKKDYILFSFFFYLKKKRNFGIAKSPMK
jgi:hypothetical protein